VKATLKSALESHVLDGHSVKNMRASDLGGCAIRLKDSRSNRRTLYQYCVDMSQVLLLTTASSFEARSGWSTAISTMASSVVSSRWDLSSFGGT
jgi:hypothetical protein